MSSGSWLSPAEMRFCSEVGRLGMPLHTSPAGTSLGTPDLAARMAPAPIVTWSATPTCPASMARLPAGRARDPTWRQDHVLAHVAVARSAPGCRSCCRGARSSRRGLRGHCGLAPSRRRPRCAGRADCGIFGGPPRPPVAEAVGAQHRSRVDDDRSGRYARPRGPPRGGTGGRPRRAPRRAPRTRAPPRGCGARSPPPPPPPRVGRWTPEWSTRASAATQAVACTPGSAPGSGWKSPSSAISACCG